MVVPSTTTSTPAPESGKGKGKGDSHADAGAVDVARMKVIDMVHALLPSEEWAGWERLGWEETPSHHRGRGRAHRRAASDVARGSPALGDDGGEQDGEEEVDEDEDEDEEEEPGYLFPNRTPASAQAIADRRRTIRSKSFSHPSRSTHPSNWASAPFPARQPLTRVKTEPMTSRFAESREAHLLGAEEEAVPYLGELGEEEAKELLEHPSLADTKLTKLVAPSHLGPSVLEALETSDDGKRLLTYEELPIHWRNNEHIFTGYRFIPLHTSGGPIPLIKSAFTWHNETVNIHSHFVPTVLILLAIPAIIYVSPLPDAHWLDTTMLVCYLLAAVSCLFTSASWHVLSGCASRRWFEWGACVDYIGISWLIAASFGTVVYNAYHCHPKTVLFYNTTNLFCGALGSYLPFQQWFNERKNKSWRIAFFLFLCFAMVAPMAQLFYEHGWDRASEFVSPFGLSIITYVAGLLFYGFHFPECIWPGRFDHLGASHQLWHTAIVGAILLHYRAVFVAHNARHAYSCAAHDADRPVGHVLESLIMSLIGA
ncbi:hypothetical protein EHS25_004683 [Saitozyma podzolica]|uniref:HlyIII-domain-containing protein n=1 Tax=Saitozyma podzolica TaxID=1890683 RepID=A0A427YUV5_9TREE|nr:hypothetical protein EHS25_004683 [Saitozyma podzolica]